MVCQSWELPLVFLNLTSKYKIDLLLEVRELVKQGFTDSFIWYKMPTYMRRFYLEEHIKEINKKNAQANLKRS